MKDMSSVAVTKADLDELAVQIVKMLEPRFDAIEKRMDAFDEKLDHLMGTLDAFLKRLDDIEKDNFARDHEIERLKHWIEQIAKKTGVQLEY